jgi:hypothetical protein
MSTWLSSPYRLSTPISDSQRSCSFALGYKHISQDNRIAIAIKQTGEAAWPITGNTSMSIAHFKSAPTIGIMNTLNNFEE